RRRNSPQKWFRNGGKKTLTVKMPPQPLRVRHSNPANFEGNSAHELVRVPSISNPECSTILSARHSALRTSSQIELGQFQVGWGGDLDISGRSHHYHNFLA